MPEIYAAQYWASNAEMIADVAKLGYLKGVVFDATYGRGTFWKKCKPESLITNKGEYDFRKLPLEDNSRTLDCLTSKGGENA